MLFVALCIINISMYNLYNVGTSIDYVLKYTHAYICNL